MWGVNEFLTVYTYFINKLGPNWVNNEPVISPIHGMRLTNVINTDNEVFNLNYEGQVKMSTDSSKFLQTKLQRVPQYQYNGGNNMEAVIAEWRDSINRVSRSSEIDHSKWAFNDILVPDITDKNTVLTLAYIAANAYVPVPHEGDWSEVNNGNQSGWKHDNGYGWDEDGLRGYIFSSSDNKTIAISIKGTSTTVFEDGGPTVPNDRINDNLLFSCCCARISYLWNTVCDCYLGNGQCDEQCLEKELYREDRYYRQALKVLDQALDLYPDTENVWLTGHSLGGAVASLLGRTYGLPVVTFEAPPEQIAVRRLHLPQPPGVPLWEEYVWHFGHNADPIYLGTCSGSSSSCWMKGYAMETRCHSGQVCVYDVAKDLGWHQSVVNHRIHIVIDDVLEVYDEPAQCVSAPRCEDCADWEFIDPLASDVSTAITPSSTKKAKGSSTSAISTTVTSTSIVTSTTVTVTSTTSSPTAPYITTTESCVQHNWYGKCQTYTTSTYTVTPDPPEPTVSCIERAWYGACEEYTTYYIPALS